MRLLLIFTILPLFSTPTLGEDVRTIYVTQVGGKALYEGRSIQTESFLTGIKKARAGTKVVVLPGTYHGNFVISKRSDPNNPITISGVSGLTTFACGDLPENDGDAQLKFSVSEGLIVENLRFEACWPSAIEITDSSYLTFRKNEFTGGHSAVRISEQASHSIAIVDNSWAQDLTSKELWQSDPISIKQDSKLSEYRGAFVHADGVLGNLIIKGNRITHSYGIFACSTLPRHRTPLTNLAIQDNEASYVRGPAISVNCPVKNLLMTNNVVDHFGLIISNRSTLEQALIWGNVFAGTGGRMPNYILANAGTMDDVTLAHNTVTSSSDFFASGTKGTLGSVRLINNVFNLTEQTPNWQELKEVKDLTFSHNLLNKKLPKGIPSIKTRTADLRFTMNAPAHLITEAKLIKDKGRQFSYQGNVVSFAESSPDAGAFENAALVPPPTALWHRLPLAADIMVLEYTLGDHGLRLQLSAPLRDDKNIEILGYEKDGLEGVRLSCRTLPSKQLLTCNLPTKSLAQVALGRAWLEEQNLVLWPSNTSLVVADLKPDREKLLDF